MTILFAVGCKATNYERVQCVARDVGAFPCTAFQSHFFRKRVRGSRRQSMVLAAEATDNESIKAEMAVHEETKSTPPTRRSILQQLASAGIILTAPETVFLPDPADAATKPYAPLQFLLPATRVKFLIDEAVMLTRDLVDMYSSHTIDEKGIAELIATLQQLLRDENWQFMTAQEETTSLRYIKQRTWGDWKKARQKETMKTFEIKDVDPLTSAVEAFEQWGERGQFKSLQQRRMALDRANKMRAAFDMYTNNLIFGDSIQVTATKEEKSRLIRTYDQLPDVTTVVRSDLDLRDLYRNEVLTYFDDAKAEFAYQFKERESGNSFDPRDILSLLQKAQNSCSEWFAFIPDKDVEEALRAIGEQKQV